MADVFLVSQDFVDGACAVPPCSSCTSKNKRDGKNGWYRYDSRFAIPVYGGDGEVERYNVFYASMLIRHSNDGKMYLYDVIDIKKETSNSLGD